MKKLLPLLLFGLLASCAAHKIPRTPAPKKTFVGEFKFYVDSYGEDSLFKSKLTYIMFPENKTNYLEMQEFKKYLVNTFKEKGYVLTENYSDAEVLIAANWNTKEKTYNYTEKIPISYETVPVKAITTQTNVSGSQSDKTTVYNDFPMRPQQERVSTSSEKTRVSNSNHETEYKYDKVATQYQIVEKTSTDHSRNLFLTAYSKQLYNENPDKAKLWSTTIWSKGDDDLRNALPMMLFGGFNYIGHSSGERKLEYFYFTTPLYNKIKGM